MRKATEKLSSVGIDVGFSFCQNQDFFFSFMSSLFIKEMIFPVLFSPEAINRFLFSHTLDNHFQRRHIFIYSWKQPLQKLKEKMMKNEMPFYDLPTKLHTHIFTTYRKRKTHQQTTTIAIKKKGFNQRNVGKVNFS